MLGDIVERDDPTEPVPPAPPAPPRAKHLQRDWNARAKGRRASAPNKAASVPVPKENVPEAPKESRGEAPKEPKGEAPKEPKGEASIESKVFAEPKGEAPEAPKKEAPEAPKEARAHAHFPPPPEDLRAYFPTLPIETNKLAWMQPISDAEEAEYSTELASVAPSELRFDFKGNLITPRLSRAIPTSRGLHHHGDAPSAAGYTLPELAHLCRSTFSPQRALAIRTAGRVLHKLRLKKFNRSSDLQEGLNALVAHTRILESLEEAADESTRNLTVRTYAIEALWLARASAPVDANAKST